jgi:drug/metabolite transporter (DMT)-like permease
VLHAEGDRVAAMAVAGVLVGLVLLPAIVLGEAWRAWPFILASATAHTFYAICLSAAYQRGALSVAYPLGRGVAPLLVTIGGWLLLAQRPDVGAVLGAGLLAAGLALIAVTGGREGQSAAVVFALLTGLTIACYSVVDAGAVQRVDPVGYLGAVLGLQGLTLTVFLRGKGARMRGSLRSGSLIALGSVVAYVLVLYAFQMAPAGRVSTLRESSVLVGILISGEQPPKAIWAGAGLVLAGALLAAG